jgi:hypothetical protein
MATDPLCGMVFEQRKNLNVRLSHDRISARVVEVS